MFSPLRLLLVSAFFALTSVLVAHADAQDRQEYFEKNFPEPDAPVFGQLAMAAEWKIWIPAEVGTLRGVVVHQHGCGDGSCDGARTAVYDLHWQELARKHDCALIAVSYRQGEHACEQWCDPRNGSAQSFLDALEYFAEASGHDELTVVPWALWGHSGGGQWVGSMCQLYPKRVVGAWLRSGCPDTVCHTFDELPMNADVCDVPMVLNLGKYEYNFSIVWVSCWAYYGKMRAQGSKIGLMMDPHTEHETGNSRYPAIRFLDDCLTARLPIKAGSDELRPTPKGVVLSIDEITDKEICADEVASDPEKPNGDYTAAERREFMKDGVWLLDKKFVDVWRKYSLNGEFEDDTDPPAPTDVFIDSKGVMTWKCRADLESGLKTFVVLCDGEELCELPTSYAVNAIPIFQGLMFSDTPDASAPKMEFTIEGYDSARNYALVSVNTCGGQSKPIKAVQTDKN